MAELFGMRQAIHAHEDGGKEWWTTGEHNVFKTPSQEPDATGVGHQAVNEWTVEIYKDGKYLTTIEVEGATEQEKLEKMEKIVAILWDDSMSVNEKIQAITAIVYPAGNTEKVGATPEETEEKKGFFKKLFKKKNKTPEEEAFIDDMLGPNGNPEEWLNALQITTIKERR